MGPLLGLVCPCFRENAIVTCKFVSVLCSLDNFHLKNVIVFFFGNQISKWRLFVKGVILTYFSHFLVTREKTQNFLQHISHLHTYTYFAHLSFSTLPILQKIRIYHVWFLFGATPGVVSYSRHFDRSINNKMVSKV